MLKCFNFHWSTWVVPVQYWTIFTSYKEDNSKVTWLGETFRNTLQNPRIRKQIHLKIFRKSRSNYSNLYKSLWLEKSSPNQFSWELMIWKVITEQSFYSSDLVKRRPDHQISVPDIAKRKSGSKSLSFLPVWRETQARDLQQASILRVKMKSFQARTSLYFPSRWRATSVCRASALLTKLKVCQWVSRFLTIQRVLILSAGNKIALPRQVWCSEDKNFTPEPVEIYLLHQR